MSETEQPFNIMDMVHGSTEESDLVLASYDTVNRMVALVGDIPFEDYFLMPLSRLVTEYLSPRYEYAATLQFADRPPLVKSTERARTYLETLRSYDTNFRSHVMQTEEAREESLRAALIGLRRTGFHLPAVESDQLCGGGGGSPMKALTNLLEYAGDVTYREIYTKAAAHLPPDRAKMIIKSVRGALKTGLIFQLNNYSCCKRDGSGCSDTLVVSYCTEVTMPGGGTGCSYPPCNCSHPPRPPR